MDWGIYSIGVALISSTLDPNKGCWQSEGADEDWTEAAFTQQYKIP